MTQRETTQNATRTVGVFDSGFGGLTVLRALLPLLQGELAATRCVYLGDTARLPYGSKSRETVARYAVSSAEFLQQQGADFLVIACNTASALALDEIRAHSRVPVLGVIETGTAAAAAASKTKSVIVLGTAATIASHAYATELAQIGIHATEKACPLLVPLVEEGWASHSVTDEVVTIYLQQALAEAAASGAATPDTLLLGCTHYPLLREVFARHAATGTAIVDSAHVTAAKAAEMLRSLPGRPHNRPSLEFYVTDSAEQFQRMGSSFLGQPIERVTHVALPE
jgi:glutamate racemase